MPPPPTTPPPSTPTPPPEPSIKRSTITHLSVWASELRILSIISRHPSPPADVLDGVPQMRRPSETEGSASSNRASTSIRHDSASNRRRVFSSSELLRSAPRERATPGPRWNAWIRPRLRLGGGGGFGPRAGTVGGGLGDSLAATRFGGGVSDDLPFKRDLSRTLRPLADSRDAAPSDGAAFRGEPGRTFRPSLNDRTGCACS